MSKGTARRLADDIISRLRAGLKPAEFMQELSSKHQDADHATVTRAFDIALADIQEKAKEYEAEAHALDTLHGMFDPEDENATVEDALRAAAANGDEKAKAMLKSIFGIEAKVFWALATAAAGKHPDWFVDPDSKGISRVAGGPGPDNAVESLIDWYQINHAEEASALELAVRGASE